MPISATRALACALAVAIAATPVLADPPHDKGKGKGKGHRDEAAQPAPSSGGPVAGLTLEVARRLAVEAGATGYKPLPPGIRRQLERGKPLPPGIAKKYAPGAMAGRLPPRPGHEWQVIGTDLVLVAIGTAIVVEVLSDVFR